MSELAFRLFKGWMSSGATGCDRRGYGARVLGVDHDAVLEGVEFDDDAGEIVVSCLPGCGTPLR